MEENKKNVTEEVTETVKETEPTEQAKTVEGEVETTLDEECVGLPELQNNAVATKEVILKFAQKEPVLKIPQKRYEELLETKVMLDLVMKLFKTCDSYDLKKMLNRVLPLHYPELEEE